MKTSAFFLFPPVLALAMSLACRPIEDGPHETARPPGSAQAIAAGDQAPCPGTADCPHLAQQPATNEPHAVDEGCEHAQGAVVNDRVEQTRNAEGDEVLQAGTPLTDLEVVAVAELLERPDDFKGKNVRVEGFVSAMCHHKRGWFSVAADDKSGRFVRVLTTPSFLVPAGSIGKRAVAEGTVELIDVSPRMAGHLAASHKLGEAGDKPVHQIVIRATGAEFSS